MILTFDPEIRLRQFKPVKKKNSILYNFLLLPVLSALESNLRLKLLLLHRLNPTQNSTWPHPSRNLVLVLFI